MKKVFAVALVAIMGVSAHAGVVKLEKAPFAGDHGPFIATSTSGFNGLTNPMGQFLTFCLEKNVPFVPGGLHNAAISTKTGGNGQEDPISTQTAYLYYNFRMGTLAGYTAGNLADGLALQEAIWALENEMNAPAPGVNKFYDLALKSNWTDIGMVRVLQIGNPDGSCGQDQLTLVPLPTAAWMGLATLGVAAGLRRRVKA